MLARPKGSPARSRRIEEKKKKKMTSKNMSKIKLPAFLYSSMQTWWLTCISIFSTYKIKGPSEKYNHIVAAFPLK